MTFDTFGMSESRSLRLDLNETVQRTAVKGASFAVIHT